MKEVHKNGHVYETIEMEGLWPADGQWRVWTRKQCAQDCPKCLLLYALKNNKVSIEIKITKE